MKEILLNNNLKILIDNEDFNKINKYHWWIQKVDKCLYAITGIKKENNKYEIILLHRFILNVPLDMEVDHKNGNGLDNRRKNLRIATHSQNMANRRLNKNNTSGFKGVDWRQKINKWRAEIKINARKKCLGFFDSKIEAAKAYDRAAVKYFGEFAKTNKGLGLLC